MNVTLADDRPIALRWAPFITVLLATVIFDRLFWLQGIGVNLPLFALIVMSTLVYQVGLKGVSAAARIVGSGLLISAAMLVVHDSIIALVALLASLVAFTVLIHEPSFRGLLYVVPQFMANILLAPIEANRAFGEEMRGRKATRTGWRWTRMAMLPVLVGVVYFQLYRVANPRFDTLTAGFLDGILTWIGDVLAELFTGHSLFFLFSLLLCGGLLFRSSFATLAERERGWTDALVRRRSVRPHWMAPLPMNALERERRRGLMLLTMLNVLLLVVNIIDINWVWFGFTVEADFDLKQFVHQGTWVLIISILLSMGILFHMFRGNQNFYARSKVLRILALSWVIQNFVLGISVFLRNYHYISFHGLAYKRIGVVVFLVLVLIGLVTLFMKIRDRKSVFHVLRVNAWAAFGMMIALTLVDWDSTIVRHNLGHGNPAEIDIDNYLAMSDKVLPILYANIDVVSRQMERHSHNRVKWVDNLDPDAFQRAMDRKRDRFLERYEQQHWQSWSWADERTYRALMATGPMAQRSY